MPATSTTATRRLAATNAPTKATEVAICGGSRLAREALALALERTTGRRSQLVLSSLPEEVGAECSVLVLFDDSKNGECLHGVDIYQALQPHQRILILGSEGLLEDADFVAGARTGRLAWLPGDSAVSEVCQAVERLYEGKPFISLRFVAWLAHRAQQTGPQFPSDQRRSLLALTEREQAVAVLVAEGLLNKQIARRLGVRVTTVKTHVRNLLYKLQVKRRDDVERRALFWTATAAAAGA